MGQQSNVGSLGFLFPLSRMLVVLPKYSEFETGLSFTTCVALAITISCLAFNMFDVWQYFTAEEEFVFLILFSKIAQSIPVLFHILSWSTKKKEYVKLINKLFYWDRNEFKLSYSRWWTVLGLACFLCELLAKFVLKQGLVNILISTINFIQLTSLYTISMQYCTFVEIISNSLKYSRILLISIGSNKLAIVHYHEILIIHAEICNWLFRRQLLSWMLFFSFNIVYCVYYCLIELARTTDTATNYVSSSMYIVRAFYSVLVVFLTCKSSDVAKHEADRFNSELFRLMRENNDLCKDEKLQVYVMMKQTVNFTACGFFTLGYPLVTSIIAAATTYLVILLQFSMQKK